MVRVWRQIILMLFTHSFGRIQTCAQNSEIVFHYVVDLEKCFPIIEVLLFHKYSREIFVQMH